MVTIAEFSALTLLHYTTCITYIPWIFSWHLPLVQTPLCTVCILKSDYILGTRGKPILWEPGLFAFVVAFTLMFWPARCAPSKQSLKNPVKVHNLCQLESFSGANLMANSSRDGKDVDGGAFCEKQTNKAPSDLSPVLLGGKIRKCREAVKIAYKVFLLQNKWMKCF